MNQRLQNKVCMILGSGTIGPTGGMGIGRTVAVLFARHGAQVFAVDKNENAVNETCKLIESEGGICVPYCADILDHSQVDKMVNKCLQTFSRIDVLHNNIGMVIKGGPIEVSNDEWMKGLNLNLSSSYFACKAVLPSMIERGFGSIIHISSLSALRMNRNQIAYASAKAGLIGFSKSVGVQYANRGIRSNCIIPGLIDTPLLRHSIDSEVSDDEFHKISKSRHDKSPTGKMGTALDVAYAALFLASDESKYINATEIVVDGGLSATL
uniref:3-oxoacyl-[acyl-carrier-protein] reductase n=1 Tax=Hirondellea gigas TaxID=1518452 RepID=A0A6A7GAD2_9CRUS